jgi:hypothetical protein
VTVTPLFFSILFLVFCEKTTGEGLGGNNHTRTEGTDPGVCISSARDVDVREEGREVVKCFFTDPCRLNGDRPRGAPSKEYLGRVGTRDLLVVSYVSSYDVL